MFIRSIKDVILFWYYDIPTLISCTAVIIILINYIMIWIYRHIRAILGSLPQFKPLIPLPISIKITRQLFLSVFVTILWFRRSTAVQVAIKVIVRLIITIFLLFCWIIFVIVGWLPYNILIFEKVARFQQDRKCVWNITSYQLRLPHLLM